MVTRTSARASRRAAAKPATPPPMMSTDCTSPPSFRLQAGDLFWRGGTWLANCGWISMPLDLIHKPNPQPPEPMPEASPTPAPAHRRLHLNPHRYRASRSLFPGSSEKFALESLRFLQVHFKPREHVFRV